jgi:4-carboxymuconolactone decarboxylase
VTVTARQRPTAPRIPPVAPESLTESQRSIAGITVSNVMRTLVRHEALLMPWLTLAGTLGISGRLTPRDRELVVLRVALRTDCAYEWAHAPLALGVGVTEAEIQALSNPSARWSDADAALLRAVDDVCADDCVSDETWSALAATRDDVQLIELLALIGFYRMNAGLLNSMGVQPEPWSPPLGEPPSRSVGSRPQSPVARPSATPSATGATTTNQTDSRLDGTWQIVFDHPAGEQQLTLVIDSRNGGLSGSVTNPALGISIPIVEGSVDGNRFSFNAPMTQPVHMDIGYNGIVDRDAISGEITIQAGGAFAFHGTRV